MPKVLRTSQDYQISPSGNVDILSNTYIDANLVVSANAAANILVSTAPMGVPPIAVTSQTLVENLYVFRAQFSDQANAYVTVGNTTQANTAFGLTVGQISSDNVYYMLAGVGEFGNVAVETTTNITFNSETNTLAVANLTSNGSNVLTASTLVVTGGASDLTFYGTFGNLEGHLTTVNPNVGTFGAANSIPIITVNDKGLVTSVSTANISSKLGLQGTNGSNSIIVTGNTLVFSSNNNVAITISNANIDISTSQDISNTASPTFANISVGNVNISGNALANNLTISGATDLNGNLLVNQNANIVGNLISSNTLTGNITASNLTILNTTTLDGNLSVGKSANISGNLLVSENIQVLVSANIANAMLIGGDLTVDKNANIAGNLIVSGSINLNGVISFNNLDIPGYATIGSNLTVGSNATSTSVTTGAITANGGLGVVGNVYIGENLFNYGTFTSLGAAVVGQSMTVVGSLDPIGGITQLTVQGDSSFTGNVYVNSGANSITPTSGALVVSGGVGIQGNLNVNGSSSFAGNVSVVGLTIDSGSLDIESPAASYNTTTGALVVAGGVGIGGNLNVNQNVTIIGDLTVVGNTTTIDSNVITIDSLNLILGNNATTSVQINNGGIILGVGNIATFLYQYSNGGWNSNIPIYAPNLFANGNAVINVDTQFSTISTQDVAISGTYDTLTTTLATVNSSTGTFGSANTVPVITVNGKGLVTNVTVSNIIPGINLGLVSNNVAANSSLVFNAALGSEFKVILNGNVTSSTFINGNIGPALICFRILQGLEGNCSFAWPTNVRSGGEVNPTANSTSIQLFAIDSDGSLDALAPMQYVFNAL